MIRMLMTLQEPVELTTVADLEVCGLGVRTIECLDRHGYMQITDLEGLTFEDLAQLTRLGPGAVQELYTAFANLRSGRRVKTVAQCVLFDRKEARRGNK
jgi:hypothetical protein